MCDYYHDGRLICIDGRTVSSHSKLAIHWMGLLIGGFVLCSQPNTYILLDVQFRRRILFLAAIVQVLPRYTAMNVPIRGLDRV